jgi:3-oxoacyl-[acyl-carrier protein] reductase
MIDVVRGLAVVTGSTSGIGKAIALSLSRAGYTVCINSRQKDGRAQALLNDLTRVAPESFHVAADLSTRAGVETLSEAVESHEMRLEVLINNAGQTLPSDLANFSWDSWQQQFDINFFSAVGLTARLYRKMIPTGSVLNISSIRGLPETGREGVMAYSAAKAALNSFTTTAAKALAPNIRVNAILPGFTATTYLERATAAQVSEWQKIAPIGRFIAPEEVADLALSIALNPAVTGSLIVIDGGFALRPG